jgi:hypothetical protein
VSQPTPPSVSKSNWTDADFEDMGWHDATVHALATRPEEDHTGRLLIDLDYIIEWVPPTDGETSFSFWLAPATLVFEHAWDLTLQIDHLDSAGLELELDAVTRTSGPAPGRSRVWTLEGHNFTLAITSVGYRQYLRKAPIWSRGQRLDTTQRGGISFAEQGYTE